MTKINKELSYAPAEFQISYCGWASPAMRVMHGVFKQQLALLCYDQAKSVEELSTDLVTAKKELFNLKFQNATNQLENTSRIKEVRRNIARIQTLIAEKSNA